MNSSGTPQSMLYQMRGQHTAPSDGNGSRNRSQEQQHSYNSGNPMNYMQFLNGQDPSLGRYTPPTLSSQSPTSPQWNNNQGGYAYNLPTAFGGFGGFSQFSQNPGMQSAASGGAFAPAKPAVAQQPGTMPPTGSPPGLEEKPSYGQPANSFSTAAGPTEKVMDLQNMLRLMRTRRPPQSGYIGGPPMAGM